MLVSPKNSLCRPSIARIASPGWSPAAAAGDPGWTSKNRRPTNGVASQAMTVKIRNATTRFISDARDEDDQLVGTLARTNERGSSLSSPSSPSSLTNPPIGSQFSV